MYYPLQEHELRRPQMSFWMLMLSEAEIERDYLDVELDVPRLVALVQDALGHVCRVGNACPVEW